MEAEEDRPVILYGMDFSVYVRIVRLVLHEKQVVYRLEDYNPFEAETDSARCWLHPFGKMPVFEHGGLRIFETQAIVRYADAAFPGPRLMSGNPAVDVIQNQIIGICDSYLYRALVWGLFVETVRKPIDGESPDEETVRRAEATVDRCFAALDGLLSRAVRDGDHAAMADLYLAPMMDYGMRSRPGAACAQKYENLILWWRGIRDRASIRATESVLSAQRLPADRIP